MIIQRFDHGIGRLRILECDTHNTLCLPDRLSNHHYTQLYGFCQRLAMVA